MEETKVIENVVENAGAIGEVATQAAGSRVGVVIVSAVLTGAVGVGCYMLKKGHDKRKAEKIAAKAQESENNVTEFPSNPAENSEEEK